MTGELPQHILGVDELSRELVEEVCDRAVLMGAVRETREGTNVLASQYQGCSMVACFEEPSTRTLVSSATASVAIGVTPVFLTGETSAMVKGESLERTALTLGAAGAKYIVMRLRNEGAVAAAARESSVPIINGGDGGNEHPTQAMLDIGTARNHLGHIDGTNWTIFGDLRHARTIKSLIKMLCKYDDVGLTLVSAPDLGVTDEIRSALDTAQMTYSETDDLPEAVRGAHVVYGVRDQQERHGQARGHAPIVLNRSALLALDAEAIILHPGPACTEIPEYVYKDPRAVFAQEQVRTGVHVRAALFDMLLGSHAYQAARLASEAIALTASHSRVRQLVS